MVPASWWRGNGRWVLVVRALAHGGEAIGRWVPVTHMFRFVESIRWAGIVFDPTDCRFADAMWPAVHMLMWQRVAVQPKPGLCGAGEMKRFRLAVSTGSFDWSSRLVVSICAGRKHVRLTLRGGTLSEPFADEIRHTPQ